VRERGQPRSVVAVKPVELVLITYHDEFGTEQTGLAVVGEKNVHLLDGKITGFSNTTTPQGLASNWLREGVFKALGRKK